jgi:uncharacterized protein (DUF2147 family)
MTRSTLALFAIMLSATPALASEASLLGLWSRGDGKALVRIEKCGSAFCAVNTWIRPDVSDEKVGDKLVLRVAAEGASRFAGEAWDPQRKTGFRIRIETAAQTMTTSGCMLAGLLCKDMNWSRQTTQN